MSMAEEGSRAPLELVLKFFMLLKESHLQEAYTTSKEILLYEPKNSTVRELQKVLLQSIQLDQQLVDSDSDDEEGYSEEGESEEDDSS